ncbi:hypothetical protein KKA15_03585 [Patescibacteria group bacterium]|nr:hypothetical protein [Patescibacteria group bacterium]
MDKPELMILKLFPDITKMNALLKNIVGEMPDTDDPAEAIRRVNAHEWVVRQADLLKQVTKVVIDGAKEFYAKDHLKEANIGWTSDSFNKLFLNKREKDVAATTIAVHNLERDSLDAPIMTELGDRTETQLTNFFELLKRQSKGEEGTLLVNGRANIAYNRGTDDNLWAVVAYWNSGHGYWDLDAYSVENLLGWIAGRQVISRDS